MKKLLSLALTVFVIPGLAADGDLDLTFGIGGRVTTDFAGSVDAATALAIQADGKIVAAGSASGDFGLVRYNPDGSMDATFGNGGKVTTDFSGRGDAASGLAIQADGRIVAAGSASGDFALARYNTDGSLDTTFGIGGKVTTDLSGRGDVALALAVQSDGKIVVTGEAWDDFALARYNSDGSQDTTFGIGGRVTTDLSGFWDSARALAIQSDGKIVVAGEASLAAPPTTGLVPVFGLVRYNRDGSLDTTFGVEGKVFTDFEGAASANALAIQTDGKIVAAGWAFPSSSFFSTFGLARYNQDGSPDTTFGIGGEVMTHPSNASSGEGFWGEASALAILPDGRLLAAGGIYLGTSSQGSLYGFGLVRCNTDGALDKTFGTRGKVITEFAPNASASAFATQADGKIVAAGWTRGSGFSDFALARYNNDLLLATGIQFDRASVRVGDSFTATFSGTNLTHQTYFDVRFRSPGSNTDQVAVNWQQGTSATHSVLSGTATGAWIVTGIRAHKDVDDHNGGFVSVSTTVTVGP